MSSGSLAERAPDLSGYARYAIYYAPKPGAALARAGAAWLGYDAATGAASEPTAPAPEIVETPRRYGFHGTLKAPFELADGCSAQDLAAALEAYVATRAVIDIGQIAVGAAHGFVALVPRSQPEAFTAAVFDVVKAFEPYRAPLGDADLARRRAAGLTARQDQLLTSYGYPYVAEQFQFHLTLSGRLDPARTPPVLAAAQDQFAGATAAPLRFDALCLFGDPGDGAPFRLLRRAPFAS